MNVQRWQAWLAHPRITAGLLLLLAFGARLWANTQTPPSPYWEEVAIGYDAYAILRTGRDHHGNPWPLVAFPSFGDYKPALYFYTVVPSIAVFGLTTFAVRLPAALFSAGSVVVMWWLGRRWFSPRVGTLAGILAAFQPWSWQVGRAGFEANLAAFLTLLGVALVVTGWERRRRLLWLVAGAGCLVLSMYAYHGARIWSPLFGLALVAWSWPPRAQLMRWVRTWLIPGAAALILALPLLFSLRSSAVQQRFQETSLLAGSRHISAARSLQSMSGNTIWSRVVFHRQLVATAMIAQEYLKHFSPRFLFARGDVNPRHSSQYLGMLYPWEMLTVAGGLWGGLNLIRRRRDRRLFVAGTLLAPVAASFTVGAPHGLRSLLLASFLALWSAAGCERIWRFLQQLQRGVPAHWRMWLAPAVISLFATGVVLSFAILWTWMRTSYPPEHADDWQYGYAEVVRALTQAQQPGEPVFLDNRLGRPAMYVWFFSQTDPRLVQAEEATAGRDQGERLSFGTWHFVGDPLSPGLHASIKPPDTVTPLLTIPDRRGKTLWTLYRVAP